MQTKAVIFPEFGKVDIRNIELPEMGEEDIRIETLYSYVSAGTELRVMEGHYGTADRFPFVPGYSYIARVTERGKKVKGFKEGDLLSCRFGGSFKNYSCCWGGHAAEHIVKANDCGAILLPKEAEKNPLPYTVTDVAAISYRGVLATSPVAGEAVLIVGQGMIGCFAAEFFRMKGCRVTVCDIHKSRLENAEKAGYSYADLSQEDAEERLQAFSGGLGYDIVAECSGSAPGFLLANRMLKKPDFGKNIQMMKNHFPRLLIQANYLDEVSVNPSRFFSGEGAVILTPADRTFEDRASVVELIRNGSWDPSPYTENIFTPDEMPVVYNKLKKHEIASVVCKWKDE